jgi:leucyl-tRNA synthetase
MACKAWCARNEVLRKAGGDAHVLEGLSAIHPVTGAEVPVVVSENQLEGIRIGLPAENKLDAAIAEKFGFTILDETAPYTERQETRYRLRDWLVSRQRSWGTPIPLVHCNVCGTLPLDTPVLQGSPAEVKCPRCGGQARREMDTLDTFFDSAWYFLRHIDPENTETAATNTNAWMPVDLYIGGIEHACMHLLYARFVHKFLRDQGLVDCDEPFAELLAQGLVLGKTYKVDGRYIQPEEAKEYETGAVEVSYEKMSKSKGNGVSPEELIDSFGADITRLALLFAAPSQSEIRWKPNLLKTMERWLV